MECTMTLFLVVDVVALILTTIWPLENAWAFHFVVAPHSFIFATIGPIVDACYKNQRVRIRSTMLNYRISLTNKSAVQISNFRCLYLLFETGGDISLLASKK